MGSVGEPQKAQWWRGQSGNACTEGRQAFSEGTGVEEQGSVCRLWVCTGCMPNPLIYLSEVSKNPRLFSVFLGRTNKFQTPEVRTVSIILANYESQMVLLTLWIPCVCACDNKNIVSKGQNKELKIPGDRSMELGASK